MLSLTIQEWVRCVVLNKIRFVPKIKFLLFSTFQKASPLLGRIRTRSGNATTDRSYHSSSTTLDRDPYWAKHLQYVPADAEFLKLCSSLLHFGPVLRIRITLMRIRILLVTSNAVPNPNPDPILPSSWCESGPGSYLPSWSATLLWTQWCRYM